MDVKILRSGTLSAIILLTLGLLLGNFGAWQPIINLPQNILGALVVSIILSTFLTFIFQRTFVNFFPGSPLVKGVLFGGLIWVVFLILGGLFAFFKDAVFPTANPGESLFLSLLLFTAWGGVMSLALESKN